MTEQAQTADAVEVAADAATDTVNRRELEEAINRRQ